MGSKGDCPRLSQMKLFWRKRLRLSDEPRLVSDDRQAVFGNAHQLRGKVAGSAPVLDSRGSVAPRRQGGGEPGGVVPNLAFMHHTPHRQRRQRECSGCATPRRRRTAPRLRDAFSTAAALPSSRVRGRISKATARHWPRIVTSWHGFTPAAIGLALTLPDLPVALPASAGTPTLRMSPGLSLAFGWSGSLAPVKQPKRLQGHCAIWSVE